MKTTSPSFEFRPDMIDRSEPEAANELASLRDFNAQLLERIGEFRKQNFDLGQRENAARAALATADKARADRERDLSEARHTIQALELKIEATQEAAGQATGALNRKLSRLSDEKWEAELSANKFRDLEVSLREEIARLETTHAEELALRDNAHEREVEKLRDANSDLLQLGTQAKIELNATQLQVADLTATKSEQAQQISEANDLMARLEEALESCKAELQRANENTAVARAQAADQAQQMGEAFRAREAQLVNAFENLRAEYSSVDGFYKESMETIARLRTQVQTTEANAERALAELHAKLQADLQRQMDVQLNEKKKLQDRLDTRDNTIEVERNKLQTRLEQVGFLDQHLQQVAATLKKEKAEVLRLAHQLGTDLQAARSSPFAEYLEAAELELSQLNAQLANTSALSPNRLKIEVRVAQTCEHRDALKALLATVEQRFEERLNLLSSIVRAANILT